MAIIDTQERLTPPRLDPPTPAEQAELLPASKLTSFLWVVFGFISSVVGAWVAGIETAELVANSTGEYAGLAYLFYVPLGWVAGLIAATLVGWSADRNRVRAGASRRLLACVGSLVPVGILIGGIVLLMTVA